MQNSIKAYQFVGDLCGKPFAFELMSFAGSTMVLIVFLGVVGFLFGVWLGDSVQIAAMGSWVSGQLAVGVVFGILGAQAGALLNPRRGERRDRRRNDRRQSA